MKEVDSNRELIQIYKERKKKMLELYDEGKSWEEAVKIVDSMDYEERIRKICPLPEYKKKEYKIGDIENFYEIVDLLRNHERYINGVKKYERLAIKLVMQRMCIGNGRFIYKPLK